MNDDKAGQHGFYCHIGTPGTLYSDPGPAGLLLQNHKSNHEGYKTEGILSLVLLLPPGISPHPKSLTAVMAIKNLFDCLTGSCAFTSGVIYTRL
jgi:hypothetical protein